MYGVTKRDFLAYEAVRVSGVVNMFDPQVRALADITRNKHIAIIQHYKEMAKVWLPKKGEE